YIGIGILRIRAPSLKALRQGLRTIRLHLAFSHPRVAAQGVRSARLQGHRLRDLELYIMSKHTGRGLYRESFERDSCGFGLIASLDDKPSHWLVETAISSLNRLTHRGAIATDGKTGDGCGLLIKMPTRFLREAAIEAGFSLTQRFAAGLVFLDPDPGKGTQGRLALTAELEREKLQVAGFRPLPTDPTACGLEALKTLPTIVQVFVNAGSDIDESTLNRKLYMARRRTEKLLEASDPMFYMPSLSASPIVSKGMVMPQFLAQFYPDLKDPRMEASVVVFHQRFSTNTLPQWRAAHPHRFLP